MTQAERERDLYLRLRLHGEAILAARLAAFARAVYAGEVRGNLDLELRDALDGSGRWGHPHVAKAICESAFGWRIPRAEQLYEESRWPRS